MIFLADLKGYNKLSIDCFGLGVIAFPDNSSRANNLDKNFLEGKFLSKTIKIAKYDLFIKKISNLAV